MTGRLLAREYVSYGVRLRFTAESVEMLQMMGKCAPWSAEVCETTSDGPSTVTEFALMRNGTYFRLEQDGTAVGDEGELAAVVEQLARGTMVHVANHAPAMIFVHAGVVAWEGSAMVLPGASFAGKSTLVVELVRAGATYYSDEYAVIDETGEVHPYARELQMREPGGVEQRAVTISDLGGHAGRAAAPVSLVVFAEFVHSGEWRPEAMSPGHAVLAMMEHSIAVQRAPMRVMGALAKMMESSIAYRSERGDAAETARHLLTLMSAERGA